MSASTPASAAEAAAAAAAQEEDQQPIIDDDDDNDFVADDEEEEWDDMPFEEEEEMAEEGEEAAEEETADKGFFNANRNVKKADAVAVAAPAAAAAAAAATAETGRAKNKNKEGTKSRRQSDNSSTCFLFDVANVCSSVKRDLAVPISAFATHVRLLMRSVAAASGDDGAFYRAVACDSAIDGRDEGAGAAKNLRKHLVSAGVEIVEHSAKGLIASSTSQVQRAVDVSLGIHLLDLADCVRPPPNSGSGAAAFAAGPRARHVVVFSSDSDMEPAIAMALQRNPKLEITLVCETKSTSRVYLAWLAQQKRVRVIGLADVLAAAARDVAGESGDDEAGAAPAAASAAVGSQGATAAAAAAAASSAAATTASPSSPMQDRPSPFARQILEIRRGDFGAKPEAWLKELEAQLTLATNPTVLKMNNDNFLLDSDLAKFVALLEGGSAAAVRDKVGQLWLDHNDGIFNQDAVCVPLLERMCTLLPQLVEVHASHTKLSPAMFNALAKSMIKQNRILYVNANTTLLAENEAEAFRGLLRKEGGATGKTVTLLQPSIGPGRVGVRIVAHFQARLQARRDGGGGGGGGDGYVQRGGGGGRGRGGRGRGNSNGGGGYDAPPPHRGGGGGNRGGRGGRGNRGRGHAYYNDSTIDFPDEQDFTADQLLSGLEAQRDAGGSWAYRHRGRGGGASPLQQQQAAVPPPPPPYVDPVAGSPTGRGRAAAAPAASRGGGARGRGAAAAAAASPNASPASAASDRDELSHNPFHYGGRGRGQGVASRGRR